MLKCFSQKSTSSHGGVLCGHDLKIMQSERQAPMKEFGADLFNESARLRFLKKSTLATVLMNTCQYSLNFS